MATHINSESGLTSHYANALDNGLCLNDSNSENEMTSNTNSAELNAEFGTHQFESAFSENSKVPVAQSPKTIKDPSKIIKEKNESSNESFALDSEMLKTEEFAPILLNLDGTSEYHNSLDPKELMPPPSGCDPFCPKPECDTLVKNNVQVANLENGLKNCNGVSPIPEDKHLCEDNITDLSPNAEQITFTKDNSLEKLSPKFLCEAVQHGSESSVENLPVVENASSELEKNDQDYSLRKGLDSSPMSIEIERLSDKNNIIHLEHEELAACIVATRSENCNSETIIKNCFLDEKSKMFDDSAEAKPGKNMSLETSETFDVPNNSFNPVNDSDCNVSLQPNLSALNCENDDLDFDKVLHNHKNETMSTLAESSDLNDMLSALSFPKDEGEKMFCLPKTNSQSINLSNSENIADNDRRSSSCSEDGSLNFNLDEICNKHGNAEISSALEENFLGIAQNLTTEIEKNFYDSSLGLEDIISAAVSEIGFEFSKEQEGLLSLDSDSNMVTASEGVVSSCSPSISSENSQQVSESPGSSAPGMNLRDMSQSSSVEENQDFIEDPELFGKRGDADGCSLSNESSKLAGNSSEDSQNDSLCGAKLNCEKSSHLKQESNNCSCKRSEVRAYEENGSILLGAWNELRSSLRQLHRSVVPSSLAKSGLSNPRSRPSINRIKALSNMLLAYDPHQLFTRVNQLSQELCIELKVRLLATIHDSPDSDEAAAFIKGAVGNYY